MTDPVDITPNNECINYVEEVQDKKTEDAIDYLFSIAGTAHGPPDQSVDHDHYLYA